MSDLPQTTLPPPPVRAPVSPPVAPRVASVPEPAPTETSDSADPWAAFRIPEAPRAPHTAASPAAHQNDPWAEFRIPEPSHIARRDPPINWSDIPGSALSHLGSSAGNYIGGMVDAVSHPIDTANNVWDLGAGALRSGVKAVLPASVFNAIDALDNQEAAHRIEQTADAAGEYLKDRAGSVDAIKKTLATDPVGAVADLSMLLTGGAGMATRAASRVPGVQQAANAVATVGRAIDPVNLAARGITQSGHLVSDVLGTTTGAGARPFREAFNAGRQGNATFTDNMRQHVPPGDVVDAAERAVARVAQDRSAAYVADMANVRGSQLAVSPRPIYQAIIDAWNSAHYQGIPIDQASVRVIQDIGRVTDNFLNQPGALMTPDRFDALKRAVGEIRQRTQQGTLERRVADGVYRSIRDEIIRQVPEYAAAMRNYTDASDLLQELRRTMSINDRAMPDTTLRKLQSTMRNNVNTNYGQRERLLDELARHEPNLPAALAGQSLNAWAPRGLARAAGPIEATLALTHVSPAAAAAIPLSSPRLMGELSHLAGRGAGVVDRVIRGAGYAGATPGRARGAYRTGYAGSTVNRATDDKSRGDNRERRDERSMGGRINDALRLANSYAAA